MEKSNQGNNGELQAVDLDLEWVHLLMSARKAGIGAEEIRRFFSEKALGEKALQVM
ncbi:anti-repressor SinI family protein [Paenibacillus sp. BAC0078]